MESLFLHTSKILYGNPDFMMYKEALPSRLRCFEDTYSYFTSFFGGFGLDLINLIASVSCKMFYFIPPRGIVKINELTSVLNFKDEMLSV